MSGIFLEGDGDNIVIFSPLEIYYTKKAEAPFTYLLYASLEF